MKHYLVKKLENRKTIRNFFKSSKQFLIKFNDIEPISKHLTVLITRYYGKKIRNLKTLL